MQKIHDTSEQLMETTRPPGHVPVRLVGHDAYGNPVIAGYAWTPATLEDEAEREFARRLNLNVSMVGY